MSSALVTLVRVLDGTNYRQWAPEMESFLMSNGQRYCLTVGTIPNAPNYGTQEQPLTPSDDTIEKWNSYKEDDAKAFGNILLRFFGRQEGDPANRIIFEDDFRDAYGMPQPTFEYVPTTKYAKEASEMMKEYVLSFHAVAVH